MGLCFAFSLPALINMNDIIPAFPEGSRGGIENAVIEGAIHYLQANAQADLLLCEYEKSARQPFNFEAALGHADKAIAQLEMSLQEYGKSIDLGQQAGYEETTIQKFKSFNYDGFTTSKSLDNCTMSLVKAYFSSGNILGAYRQNADNIAAILVTLQQVKERLAAGLQPDVSLFWQISQQFALTSLFGSYCTMTAQSVFKQ
jgi:hypothetical protein